MRRGALAYAETYKHWEDNPAVLLVADEDEGLGHVVRELDEAFHGLGAGGVETGDVDCDIALEVGDGY